MNSQLQQFGIGLMRGAALSLTVSAVMASHSMAANYDTRSSRPHMQADGSLVDVSILVDGDTSPLFYKPGTWDRHYFQARKGRNYSVVLRNNTGERVGVLMAVDGLNVITGSRSHLSRNESMYVLDPWESTTIRGWRSSLSEVRRFVFVDEERSYAERTGQANGDMGWIRVLSFRENTPWYGWNKVRRQLDNGPRAGRDDDEGRALGENDAAPAPSAPGERAAKPQAESYRGNGTEGPTAQSNPGTGWGDRRHDPVRETEFQAARQATDHFTLRYEYLSGLRALGIEPGSSRNRLRDRERGELGFAQPPRR